MMRWEKTIGYIPWRKLKNAKCLQKSAPSPSARRTRLPSCAFFNRLFQLWDRIYGQTSSGLEDISCSTVWVPRLFRSFEDGINWSEMNDNGTTTGYRLQNLLMPPERFPWIWSRGGSKRAALASRTEGFGYSLMLIKRSKHYWSEM